MKSIYLLFTLFILASCGSKEATSLNTSFVFTSGLSALDSQSGGIVLYGRNVNDASDAFTFVVGRDGEKLELNNGTWKFMAVSWDGYNSNLSTYGNKFEGQVRCSLIDNKVLEGGDVELTIILNQATCSDTKFGLSDTKNGSEPKITKIQSCSNVDYFEDGGSDNSDCYRSVGGSFQTVLMMKDQSGKVSETMRSRCIVNNSTVKTAGELNSIAEHELRLPIFFPYDISPVWSVEVFEEADCSKQISKSTFIHPYAEEITGSLGSFDSDTENAFIVYSPVCNTNLGASATPFEAYKGSATTKEDSYYVLCNKGQIQNYVETNTGYYRLGRDIDFGGEVYNEWIIGGNFNGDFNGDGHTLSNFTIVATDSTTDGKGLFSSATSAQIYNLKLDSISIQCSNTTKVGALAGNLDLTSINNISVSNIDIDNNECGSIGAIVGQADNMSGYAYGIHADSVSMELSGDLSSNIGGAFGFYYGNLSNSTFRNISIVPVSNPIALVNNYGGAIGSLENGDSVSNIMVENIQIGSISNQLDYAQNVGLFAGRIYNSQSVDNIKVSGEIHSDTNTFQVGGVAGEIEVSGAVSVSNLLSNVNINSLGTKTGGIFGFATNTNNIKLLRSFGQIACISQCGGITGSSDSSNYTFLYSDVNLSASTNISISDVGGLLGIVNGTTSVTGGQNDGEIYFPTTESTSSIVGGIIGKYNSTGALSYLINHGDVHGRGAAIGGILGSVTKEDGDLINFLNTGTIISDNNDSYFLVGDFSNPGGATIYYDGIYSGFYAVAGIADVANTGAFQTITSTSLTVAEAASLSTFATFSPSVVEEYNSEAIQLSMVSRLKKMSGLDLMGNEKEPFILTTPEQWNLIGDSEVFMSSHFSLGANLDFSGINFTSVGSDVAPFSGGLKGNGFGLDNIEINTPAVVVLSGTVDILSGSSHLLGTGTTFTSELKAGDHIYVSGFPFVVVSILNDTNLIVRTPHASTDVSGANFSIVPANSIGVFGRLANARINTPSNEYDEYNEKFYIRNFQVNMPETNGSTHIGALAANASGANSVQGVVVDNANITAIGSGADALYIGGLIGLNDITTDEYIDWRYIDVLNSSINASGGDYSYVGGVFGQSASYSGNPTEHKLKAIRVIDTELNGYGVGGIAYQMMSDPNVSLNFENILIQSSSGHSFTASSSEAGGLFGYGSGVEVHHYAVNGINISSQGASTYVGGIAGKSEDALFKGGYVKANVSVNEGEVGCLIGYTPGTGNTTIENSYANCDNVQVTNSGISSYLVANTGALNIAPDNNVFYIAPSDESIGISGFNYISESNLANETYMATNFPNFLSGDPWFWNTPGETPVTVMEAFPQYFFE